MTMNVAIIVFCGMLFWLGILAAGKSAPVLCDWDHDDLSASADSMTYGLTQCELNAGPIPTTDGSTQLSIFYASTQQNPDEGQCPGDVFTSWTDSNTSQAILTQQIRTCCFSPSPVLLFNGPKKKLWNVLMSSDYPSCLSNEYANPTDKSRRALGTSENDRLLDELSIYTFGNSAIGKVNFVWENNLTVTGGGGAFSFVTVDYYPPRYFSAGERPTIVDSDGNVYVLQTYLTTTGKNLTNEPGVDPAYLSYIGTNPGQCCHNLPDGWKVSIEVYEESLCAGCCYCNNTVFADDNSWTWALVSGPPATVLSGVPTRPIFLGILAVLVGLMGT